MFVIHWQLSRISGLSHFVMCGLMLYILTAFRNAQSTTRFLCNMSINLYLAFTWASTSDVLAADFCQHSWGALNLTQKHLKHPNEPQLGPCCFASKPKTKSWEGHDVLPNILVPKTVENCALSWPPTLCPSWTDLPSGGLPWITATQLNWPD